ncbi:MAG: N-acetyl-gamma-glutamyl-phosphate reductase [Burkholderiaceae bacterium]|nr:N-acetyl-gamma-glutamyl-phosphate reductase [Burkholderiaceae bacterium]
MKHRVFVDGQEGTTGLRIHEYLAQRDDIDVLRIDPELRKDAAERARLLNAADVAFLCLPDAASREAAALVTNPATCLIDASTAHRTAPGWVFGLPELAPEQRAAIRASKRIANPGCHASAFILLIRPLVDAGLLASTTPVTATSITGYSGGGKSMIRDYEAAPLSTACGSDASIPYVALAAPRPYALALAHKHLPEMKTHTGLSVPPVFMPIVGPFYKGLTVSVPLHLAQLSGSIGAADLREALARRYAGERFIRVMPLSDEATLAEGFFDVQASNDTNRVDLFVFASDTQVLLMARLDNLGKGASGAAVQSMNVHLGIDEGLGL